MLREALPVLESVTVCAALVEPIFTWLNVRLAGERLTMGAGAGGELPPPPLPPQATQTPTTSRAVANSQPAGRRRAGARLRSVARANNPAKSQGHPVGKREPGGTLKRGAGGTTLTWAVVLTVTVAVAPEVPATFNDAGEIVQLMLVYKLTQLRFTVPVNPFNGATVIVEVPDCPGAGMVMLAGFADILKSVTLTVAALEVEPV
jgi:hypothetical protein